MDLSSHDTMLENNGHLGGGQGVVIPGNLANTSKLMSPDIYIERERERGKRHRYEEVLISLSGWTKTIATVLIQFSCHVKENQMFAVLNAGTPEYPPSKLSVANASA